MSEVMPFSSQEQVQKSYDFLNSCKSVACPGCARGVRMCYHTPCIGTVDDIEKLIDAGYAKNLMLDWFSGGTRDQNPFTEDILYLCPAVIGSEGRQAKFARTGRCNLLVNNQCSVHDKNLKPIQGKLACCKVERLYKGEDGMNHDIDERIPVLHTWNTEKGLALIERWKKEVGLDEVKDLTIPNTLFDQLTLVMEVMGSLDAMQSAKGKDGRPDYNPNEVVEREIEIYEKPY
jgi:hypothetical protein